MLIESRVKFHSSTMRICATQQDQQENAFSAYLSV